VGKPVRAKGFRENEWWLLDNFMEEIFVKHHKSKRSRTSWCEIEQVSNGMREKRDLKI
jgi:hypothetical protein